MDSPIWKNAGDMLLNHNKPYDLVILQFSIGTKEPEDVYVRTLGAEKIAWIADRHGYKSICISRLGLLSKEEMISVIQPYIDKKTVIGISTSLMTPPAYYVSAHTQTLPKNLEDFIYAVNTVTSKCANSIVLGGPTASEFKSYFNNSEVLESTDGENDIIKYLNIKLSHGISKKKIDTWSIHNDDFTFLPNSFIHKHEMLPLEINRGCIFSCKFCSFDGIGKTKGTYEKPMNRVREYLIHNYQHYGTQHYFLTADTVNDSDETMNQWCDMLESLPFTINYTGFFRIDLLYKYQSTAKRLYQTGLRGLNLGIETFHEKAARLIEKPFSGDRAKDFLLKLHYDILEENAVINTGMIIGIPYETMDSVKRTVDWFKNEGRCIIPNWNALMIPCPKRAPQNSLYQSKFAKNAEKYGFRWPTDNYLYWEHDTMNKFQATKAYLRIVEEFKPMARVSNWNHVQRLACNNDFSFIDNYFKKVKENAHPKI